MHRPVDTAADKNVCKAKYAERSDTVRLVGSSLNFLTRFNLYPANVDFWASS
jgi:hypothetical protein